VGHGCRAVVATALGRPLLGDTRQAGEQGGSALPVGRDPCGPGVVVAGGTTVVDSVVMAGARIDAGCRIERSIIGARASIGAACELDELTVVGFDEDVPAGTTASGGSLPPPESW